MDTMKHRLKRHGLSRCAYTLIEVLAASAVVAVGMTGAVSLSSSLMLQEELSWRVAVTRNHQENMARLWQLGLSPAEVMALMPAQSASPLLNQAIHSASITSAGTTDPSGLGVMQSAYVFTSANVSQDPRAEIQGAPLTLSVYRPSLPMSLRPPAP